MDKGWRGAVLLALACAAPSAWADGVTVRLTEHKRKTYLVEGVFTVEAASAAVWNVLSDYDDIPRFVPSMRHSRLVETRPDGVLVVDQEAVGSVLFFSKEMHVLLAVRREGSEMSFADTGHKDFRYYSGTWTVLPSGRGTEVSYRLEVEPDFLAPGVLMRRGLKRGAAELLEQVRAEISRRARG